MSTEKGTTIRSALEHPPLFPGAYSTVGYPDNAPEFSAVWVRLRNGLWCIKENRTAGGPLGQGSRTSALLTRAVLFVYPFHHGPKCLLVFPTRQQMQTKINQ